MPVLHLVVQITRCKQTLVIDKSSLERDRSRSTHYRSTSAIGSGPNISATSITTFGFHCLNSPRNRTPGARFTPAASRKVTFFLLPVHFSIPGLDVIAAYLVPVFRFLSPDHPAFVWHPGIFGSLRTQRGPISALVRMLELI